MPKFLIVIMVMCICGIFSTVTVLVYLKLKLSTAATPQTVVLFSFFKNFKCLGDVLDSGC